MISKRKGIAYAILKKAPVNGLASDNAYNIVMRNHTEKVRAKYLLDTVEDLNKNNGWIHKSLISGNRTAVIVSNNDDKIKIFNTIEGLTIGNIGKGNIVSINKCKIDWCSISFNNYKGWIYKKNIWGVEDKEIINVSYFQVIIDLYWKSHNHFQKMSSVF